MGAGRDVVPGGITRRRAVGSRGILLGGLVSASLLLGGCGVAALVPRGGLCVEASPRIALSTAVRESSGLAPAGWGSRLLWTHNDSGWPADLFLVDEEGTLHARVRVEGAGNEDWEDLAVGPCPGASGRCLYIADTGDNFEVREQPAIYRVPEPGPGDTVSRPAERFPMLLPHGPRDIEAIYLLPGERLHLVTKGRNHPVEVYRLPAHLGEPGEILVPERIQTLTDRPTWTPRHVTGAAATPAGDVVAVRTYETLEFFRPDDEGRLHAMDHGPVNLRPLREAQGEAVTFLADGRIALSSEGGPGGRRGSLQLIECRWDSGAGASRIAGPGS